MKHPTFAKFQLVALGDAALVGINCGLVYAQHAHPAGPTAWAAAQVADRTLRWLEAQPHILAALNASGNPEALRGAAYEQSVYNDALWSIVAGRPVFAHSLRPVGAGPDSPWDAFHNAIGPGRVKTEVVRRETCLRGLERPWLFRLFIALRFALAWPRCATLRATNGARSLQVEVPVGWAEIVADRFDNTNRTVELRYYDTQLVSSPEPRDPHLGPAPFPEERGPLSAAVQAFLHEGAPAMWPDWERADLDITVRLAHVWQVPERVHASISRAGVTLCSSTQDSVRWLHATPVHTRRVCMVAWHSRVMSTQRFACLTRRQCCSWWRSGGSASCLRPGGSWARGTTRAALGIGTCRGRTRSWRTWWACMAHTNRARN